jgi:hypothetical protein
MELFERREVRIWTFVLLGGGIVAAMWGLPEDWSITHKLSAGIALGLGSLLSVFTPRMIGGDDFN